MTTYANGQAPESALVMVTGVHCAPSVGSRLLAFFAWAATQGHTLRVFDGRTAHPAWTYACGGYCTIPEQQERYNGGKPSGGSTIEVAAAGGSTHGEYAIGRADIVGADGHSYTPADLAFIIAHAATFGLVREFGDRDPNHFKADSSTPYPTTTPTEEPDMAKPILIQNTEPGTTNYGMVLKLADNGKIDYLTAAQRDAWVFKGVEVWACTSGHFEYFYADAVAQQTYLANLVGRAVPTAPAAPTVSDDELKALIAGIPDAVVKAQGKALSNG